MRNARWPVWCILLLALAAELLPLPAVAQPLRPAFTTMVLIYWTLMWPGRFGIFTAFLFGLLIDIAHGSLLGQHALTRTGTPPGGQRLPPQWSAPWPP